MANWNALRAWAAAVAGIPLSDDQVDRLSAYLDVLRLWGRRVALVSQRDDVEAILAKHFADSLFAAAHCADGESVVDLGSGAGFPGLPIAIAHPRCRVTLIESRGKKASFLVEAARVSGVRNVTVVEQRIQVAATQPEHAGRYAVAIARALADTITFLRLACPFLGPDGRAIAMRSATETIVPGGESIDYELPDGTPRRLVVYPAAEVRSMALRT